MYDLHRIQFNLYFAGYKETDGIDFRTLISSVVDLKETIMPDIIKTHGSCSSALYDLDREKLVRKLNKYREALDGIKTYAKNSEEETKMERRSRTYVNPHEGFRIKDIQFNGPATIIMWMDGTKTVVKCKDGEVYDQEKAIAMAISRRALGEEGYSSVFHAKEFAEKELRKLKKRLSVLEDQYSQMSNKKKVSRHKSAVELESKIKSCKKGVKHFEKIIKKFTPPETIEQVDTPVNGEDLPPVTKS